MPARYWVEKAGKLAAKYQADKSGKQFGIKILMPGHSVPQGFSAATTRLNGESSNHVSYIKVLV